MGSYGAVARVTKERRQYALKILDPHRRENGPVMEEQILQSLDHPAIPRFVELFTCNGLFCIVEGLVPGFPLSYHIAQDKRFTEEEVRKIVLQLLHILAYLHGEEKDRPPVIHRDLRLSNVFWSGEKVYLVDFGLAGYEAAAPPPKSEKPASRESGIRERCPGRSTYTALRNEFSPKSDLFGAGVVALDLFATHIEDEKLFEKPWQEIFPGSGPLKEFIKSLLDRRSSLSSAEEACRRLKDMPPPHRHPCFHKLP